MEDKTLSVEQLQNVKKFQKNEITEHTIYARLASKTRNKENKKILEKISNEELTHYHFWKKYTNSKVNPNRLRILFYYLTARIFGLTFGIKLMERGETKAQYNYSNFQHIIPDAAKIALDEDAHEKELIGLINEEKLNYMGSVVLGLNDALVELTGTLAGLTFALQNTRIIALVGLVTGIAAGLSMAASEYLSTKSEESANEAWKSALYTGVAYFFTVIVLIVPYFLFVHYLVCLGVTILLAILVIYFFNYYLSVAKDLNFRKRFVEMLVISLGVAVISFGIGLLIRKIFGVEV
jgi:vacuolar iron transporter family protein